MRNAFAAELKELATGDERIVLLSGDIGNRLFDGFKRECQGRFFNCGVAEANMTGVAAGMAMCGLRPITYTITTFNTYRCLEQIRLDVCYHNLPVIIVGVGAGLSYAGLGATHQSLEDITMLRMLPNMTVICPSDAVEVRLALRAAVKHEGPVYIRLGKKNEPIVHKQEPLFEIGKGIIIQDGSDICILSTGNMLPVVIDAALHLQRYGVSARVVSMHTVKPLDADLLEEVFTDFDIVVTIEEHSLIGGFGSSIAEWVVDRQQLKGRLCRIGIADKFLHGCGDQENARNMTGLTSDQISEKILA
ncbi:MAG: transketolase, partial [Candidatus Aminicenantes bacterium]|nr:transketolase [Candidatus Aminicenantes bacterium]